MNIGIDARWIFRETSGIGAYTSALIRALAACENEHRFTLFFHDRQCRDRLMSCPPLDGASNRFRAVRLPFGLFSLWGQAAYAAWLRAEKIDLLHSTNYLIPLPAFPRHRRGRIKAVVTIHDVIPLLFPRAAPRSVKSRFFGVYRRLMIEIGKRAHAIISDSKASRRDIIRELDIPAPRQSDVAAVYCGVDTELFSPPAATPDAALTERASNRCRTVLYVGRSDPYKNLVGLLKAFNTLRQACDFPTRLRIAGPPDKRYPQARQTALALGLAPAVEWTGYLTEAQLVAAYRDADLLALPSYYEGFGLPVIEAMACGTPVVCSNRGSLPEVAGEAALIVDPDHEGALAAALKRALTDRRLRERLRRSGLRRAREFAWERTARETLAVYERAGRHEC